MRLDVDGIVGEHSVNRDYPVIAILINPEHVEDFARAYGEHDGFTRELRAVVESLRGAEST